MYYISCSSGAFFAQEILCAAVAESADARDLKSLGSNIVPVQVWSAAPRKRV